MASESDIVYITIGKFNLLNHKKRPSINQSVYYPKKAGHTIHINVRLVKVDLYKFTLPALSAP